MIEKFDNYIDFLKSWILSHPKKGRGISAKMASTTGVSTVLMSQILNGSRLVTEDHAFKITVFCKLNPIETELFMTMVRHERAGTKDLKNYLFEKVSLLKNEILKNDVKVQSEETLTEAVQAEFYSHWKYSFIRLALALPEHPSIEDLASFFQLPNKEVEKAVSFLLKNDLLKLKDGKYSLGPSIIHLPKTSPLFFSRQTQVRNLALTFLAKQQPADLFFSAPFSASKKDVLWLKGELLDTIDKLSKRVKDTKAEQLCCVNLDLFHIL